LPQLFISLNILPLFSLPSQLPRGTYATTPFSVSANEAPLRFNQNNDHGLWFEQNIFVELPSNFLFQWRSVQRFGGDYRVFWYHDYSAILTYKLSKLFAPSDLFTNFLMGPGYNGTFRLQRDTRRRERWVYIHRPLLEVHLFMSWKDWTLTQRLRSELHFFAQKIHFRHHDHALIRYRVALNAPWKWTPIKIQPFVSNEFFFRDQNEALVGGYHQNRFRVGLDSQMIKELSLGVFWQWLSDKRQPEGRTKWIHQYHYGLVLTLSF
jgi:hypothetical protein